MDDIDRISELPGFISHHILSFLDKRSAATTSVLSKHWNSVWNSFPILQFDLFIPYVHEFYAEAKADAFVAAVDEAFRRRTRRNLRVQRLDLCVVHLNSSDGLVSRINQWLALALCNGAREILVSAYMRRFLHLSDTLFVAKPVKGGFCPRFGSLVKLVLHYVCISESHVRNIVLNCPNLEVFELLYFSGLKALEISKLERIEKVKLISANSELERIDIDAPSLKELNYWSYQRSNLHTISLASCRDLTSLCLSQCVVTDDWLHSHLSRFPRLETLVVKDSPALQNVRVSAPLLRTLRLSECENVEVVEIDAPTLSSFEFSGLNSPVLLSENAPCPMKIVHNLHDAELATPWFLNLRNNLAVSTDQRKIVFLNLIDYGARRVRVHFSRRVLSELVDEAPPMVNVDHLTIGYYITSDVSVIEFECLIDGLLWSCHPNTISVLCSGHLAQRRCMMALCNKLLISGMSCGNHRVKCWHQDLKAAKLKSFRGISEDEEEAGIFKEIKDNDSLRLCLYSLLKSESLDHNLEICFGLEWNC